MVHHRVIENKWLRKVFRATVSSTVRGRQTVAALPLSCVASIQSQYELSRRYKYSDPAVVLMSKVYQTTDSIHVETAMLPWQQFYQWGRSGRLLESVCSIMGWREGARVREREREAADHCS